MSSSLLFKSLPASKWTWVAGGIILASAIFAAGFWYQPSLEPKQSEPPNPAAIAATLKDLNRDYEPTGPAADAYWEYVSQFEAAQLPYVPINPVTPDDLEALCLSIASRPVQDQTAKAAAVLCSGEFQDIPDSDPKKQQTLYKTLHDALARDDISHQTKTLVHHIVLASLPTSQVQGISTAHAQVGEDNAVAAMQTSIAKARSACTSSGYDNFVLNIACSVNDFTTGQNYSDQFSQYGGLCPFDEMGRVELTRIYADTWNYMGSQYDFAANEGPSVTSSRQVSCSFSCAVSNCARHTQAEAGRKGCVDPVYYPLDTAGGGARGARLADENVAQMCEFRGITQSVNRSTGAVTVNQADCNLSQCDQITLDTPGGPRQFLSCCCSCANKETSAASRKTFDPWDWDGPPLLELVLRPLENISLETTSDIFATPEPDPTIVPPTPSATPLPANNPSAPSTPTATPIAETATEYPAGPYCCYDPREPEGQQYLIPFEDGSCHAGSTPYPSDGDKCPL